MIRLLVPLLGLVASLGDSGGPPRKPIMAIAVTADVAVRIYNLVGTTRVTGWDRDSIVVFATIPPRAGSFFGGGRGAFAKLGIEGQDPSLAGPGSDLEVRVPRGARVWIKSASATVDLHDLGGEVEVTSVTGAIHLEGSPRVTTLESIDGDLTIVGTATVIRARTGAGAVTVTGARGDLAVSTVQGPVTITSDQLLSARIESVSGTVRFTSGVPADGLLDIVTHDGDVRLLLPATTDARFDLSTVKGTIATGLPGRPAAAAGEHSVRFAVGKKAGVGRGAGITVRTFSGRIAVDSNPGGG